MKKTVNCGRELEVIGQKGGHSMMDKLWGGPGDVVYTSYRCENGHEYETTGADRRCTSRIANQQRKSE